jgi:hypothetical protein
MTTYLALHGIHALAPNYINSDDGSANSDDVSAYLDGAGFGLLREQHPAPARWTGSHR